MATGYWVSRIVYVGAQLKLADFLASGPRSAAELSGPTGSHPRPLHRLMRTLASFGILSEGDDSRFALTPLGDKLKTGAPGSARSSILSMAGSGRGVPGGEERTEQESRTLLGKAGFTLTSVVPTASPVNIVEARLA